MNVLRITSRKNGQTFDFEQRGAYLYCNGYQICHGGGYRGRAMYCIKGDLEQATKMCRSWYNQMMRKETLFDF